MKLKRCKLQCELGFCKVKLKILYNYMTGIKKKYSEDTQETEKYLRRNTKEHK